MSASENGAPMHASDLDLVLQKLKLLQFGLYGLQHFGRHASLDVEDLSPFYRLAEEIEADVLALQCRLADGSTTDPGT